MKDTIFVVDLTLDHNPKCKVGVCAFDDFLEPLDRTMLLVRMQDAERTLGRCLLHKSSAYDPFNCGDGTYRTSAHNICTYLKRALDYEKVEYETLRDFTDTGLPALPPREVRR